MKRLLVVLSLALMIGSVHAGGKSGGYGHSGAIGVKGYYRSNGTYVGAHTRSAPGSRLYNVSGYSRLGRYPALKRTEYPAIKRTKQALPWDAPSYPAWAAKKAAYVPTVIKRTSKGRIARSSAAKSAFKRANPCPGTGAGGACNGYIIDHIIPLKKGGADAPSNMQWQTTEAAKAKDKWE